MTTITVPAHRDFRFDYALRYLGRSDDEILDIVDSQQHRRVIPGITAPTLIETTLAQTRQEPALSVRTIAGEADPAMMRDSIARIFLPSTIMPLNSISESMAGQLLRTFRGLPVVQTLTPWEALVWAILGQQINIAFAYRIKRRFVEQFGTRLVHDSIEYFAFPGPERVAALDHDKDLRPIQFSRQKSRYVIAAARSVMSGELDLQAITHLDDDNALSALQRQIGIGRWTAEYILLRGYARLNVIPAGDAALKLIVGRHLDLGRTATEEEVRELAEGWKPWRGQIGFMLWFARQAGWFTS